MGLEKSFEHIMCLILFYISCCSHFNCEVKMSSLISVVCVLRLVYLVLVS